MFKKLLLSSLLSILCVPILLLENKSQVIADQYMEEPNLPGYPGYESPIRYSDIQVKEEYAWPPCQEITEEKIQALREAGLYKE